MQPAQTWQQPIRKVVFTRTDNARTFTVTLHSHCNKDAGRRAKQMLRECHRDNAALFGPPAVQLITQPVPARKSMRDITWEEAQRKKELKGKSNA